MNFSAVDTSNTIVKTETLKLQGDWVEPMLEGHRIGDEVVISYGGFVLHQFDRCEPGPRDLAIAVMLRAGISAKTVARLSTMSRAHVCGVQQRVDLGGTDALFDRSRPGQFSKITDVQREQIRIGRAGGMSIVALAQQMGISQSVMGRVVLALPAPIVFTQPSLPPIEIETVQGESFSPSLSSVSPQQILGSTETVVDTLSEPTEQAATPVVEEEWQELEPGAVLPPGPAQHPCRYAGTLLLCAAASILGVFESLEAAKVERPKEAVYPAHQIVMALIAAWGSGLGSLEAMHERDARALGVVLGLERSPSVRTLHRAIAQMIDGFDPIELQTGLLCGVMAATERSRLLFGVDGHIKPYAGKAPIDKGYDTKRRMAVKALADVRINDEYGWTWSVSPVRAGDALSEHLCASLKTIRTGLDTDRPIVLASDRGGFAFETLNALAVEQGYYISYVPATVSMGDLSTLAPEHDGVGQTIWTHGRLKHPTRLIVVRDRASLIPIVSNLPTLVPAESVVQMLRDARGWQENSIRAAKAFVQIDSLNDRGGARVSTDDRLVTNPARTALKQQITEAKKGVETLARQRPIRGQRTLAQIETDEALAKLEQNLLEAQLRNTRTKVPRNVLEPTALRAWLKTRNRTLLSPLKHAADNARRWLLAALGTALASSAAPYDASAMPRTLLALMQTGGTVEFSRDRVVVTLELPLPPTPHQRLAEGLESLDSHQLLFSDGQRPVLFRLAPRLLRCTLPSVRIESSPIQS